MGRRLGDVAFAVFAAVGRLAGPLHEAGWVCFDDDLARSPQGRWEAAHIPPERVALRTNSRAVFREAVSGGTGVGILPCSLAAEDPHLLALTEVIPELSLPLWLLTHPDLAQMPRAGPARLPGGDARGAPRGAGGAAACAGTPILPCGYAHGFARTNRLNPPGPARRGGGAVSVTLLIGAAAAMRVVIGLAPILAARPVSRLLGFPEAHDNPTARLMGRLFGVRDIGLGVLAVGALLGQVALPFAILFNAATDLGDAAMIAIPLLRRDGIDRAALGSLGMALAGGTTWMILWSLGGATP